MEFLAASNELLEVFFGNWKHLMLLPVIISGCSSLGSFCSEGIMLSFRASWSSVSWPKKG